MKKLFSPLLLLAVVLTAIGSPGSGDSDTPVPPEYSALWGETGELWDPENGPLRDFTNVGYLQGGVAIPDWPVGANVRVFGALGDAVNDDTQAFRDAIAACPENTAVFVPNGTYKILGQIRVDTKDNFVLRGEDMHQTILWMPTYLNEGGEANFNADTTIQAVFYVSGGTQRSIENFSFVFRNEQKGGHWQYLGNNAIKFVDVKDSWIRNIHIKNSDHGIALVGHTRNVSVLNILLDQFINRANMTGELGTGKSGHQPIALTDADHCLIHNVVLTGRWHHDVVTQGDPDHNVISRYRGPDMVLDHHSMGGNNNLFTEIDTGEGRSSLVGPNNQETYWNIRSRTNLAYPDPAGRNVVVGMQTDMPTDTGSDYWHETIDPAALFPANLYLAQMAKLGKPLPVEVSLAVPPPPPGIPITIHPVEDSMISGATPDIPNPKGTTLLARDNRGISTTREAYIKFDLNGLDLADVVGAKLKVYMKSVNYSHDVQFQAVADDSWTERTLTYNNRPPGGDPLGTLTGVQQGRWYELDITAYVLGQFAADQVVSLKMFGMVKDRWAGLSSREEGNAPILRLEKAASSPPAAPTGLNAVPGDNLVSLDWPGSYGIDFAGYSIYRSTTPGTYGKALAGNLFGNLHLDETALNGNTYYYVLTATDGSFRESPPSPEVAVHVLLDTDGDGMDDLWEDLHFPDPPGSDGTIDSDKDGVLDFFEYLYGSVPTDGNSKGFRFQASGSQNGTHPTLAWEVKDGLSLGRDYHLLGATDLGDWNHVPETHYSLATTRHDGRTRMELMIHHDYGDRAFFKLAQP